jgi:histidyl-tRNA synthetase
MSGTATPQHQAPKGTRDFFPADMALRRHVESVWRGVSIAHGFEEVDGPTFEHLGLYTVKSGPGIVSELFSFRRAGGEDDYALRPEFTPTLARMVAERGAQLAKPLRWFCMPAMFRAERPQRGRLREHIQWNVDIVGQADAAADADVVAVMVGAMQRLGLGPQDVRVRLSHRPVIAQVLAARGIAPERHADAFGLLDRRDKLERGRFEELAREQGFNAGQVAAFDALAGVRLDLARGWSGVEAALARALGPLPAGALDPMRAVCAELEGCGVAPWCDVDPGIVRGLAYYTGTVFEIHEAAGRERAIAGGGRYDNLVELFGGPPTPAVGIAMGDVVIRLVLEERGLLGPPEEYLPRPDVFVINARDEGDALHLRPLVHRMRRAGLHVRHSGRSTRNVGKLLGEAARCGARVAVILGRELEEGRVSIKDLGSGEQREAPLEEFERQMTASTRARPPE